MVNSRHLQNTWKLLLFQGKCVCVCVCVFVHSSRSILWSVYLYVQCTATMIYVLMFIIFLFLYIQICCKIQYRWYNFFYSYCVLYIYVVFWCTSISTFAIWGYVKHSRYKPLGFIFHNLFKFICYYLSRTKNDENMVVYFAVISYKCHCSPCVQYLMFIVANCAQW